MKHGFRYATMKVPETRALVRHHRLQIATRIRGGTTHFRPVIAGQVFCDRWCPSSSIRWEPSKSGDQYFVVQEHVQYARQLIFRYEEHALRYSWAICNGENSVAKKMMNLDHRLRKILSYGFPRSEYYCSRTNSRYMLQKYMLSCITILASIESIDWCSWRNSDLYRRLLVLLIRFLLRGYGVGCALCFLYNGWSQ